jgi:hypothetical protein
MAHFFGGWLNYGDKVLVCAQSPGLMLAGSWRGTRVIDYCRSPTGPGLGKTQESAASQPPMANSEDFRQRATDCLTLSERSVVPRHKELFLRMAQTWLALADQKANTACDPLAAAGRGARSTAAVLPSAGPPTLPPVRELADAECPAPTAMQDGFDNSARCERSGRSDRNRPGLRVHGNK